MLEQPLLFDFREPDWERWVPVTATRNWMKEDPILDWLDLYGLQHGFMPDDEEPTYIPAADFGQFMRDKGRIFEGRILELLEGRLDGQMVRVAPSSSEARSQELYEKTIQLMRAATPAISSGVLWNFENQTYGVADLLVRSDVLNRLVETPPVHSQPDAGAPALGLKEFHYVVVEIKYKGFKLAANYEVDNSSTGHHKVQLALYNAALGSTQGFTPPQAYFLGRKWEKGSGKKHEASNSCLNRLVHVSMPIQDGSKPVDWLAKATEAVNWVKTVRQQGSEWQVVPKPTNKHLYPNMGFRQDSPWHAAKGQIADQIGDPTRIWHVGLEQRRRLMEAGCCDWRDPQFDMSLVAEEEGSKGPRIRRMIEINRTCEGLPYWPATVDWSTEEWREPDPLEFYVDFETTGNQDDDFKSLPEAGGQPLIFMIGCGHWEPVDGDWSNPAGWMLDPARRRWQFKVFYTNSLTEPDEKQIIVDWYRYMEEVRSRTPGAPQKPKVFHWSPAETSTFVSSSSSAYRRHLEPSGWPEPNWFDFLGKVIKPKDLSEAFFVRGAWGFGLKAIGKALFKHGFIQTEWKDGPADGLAAMGGCWACYRLAEEQRRLVVEVELPDVSGKPHRLFQEIIDYNEVDCRVMAECIEFIRSLSASP